MALLIGRQRVSGACVEGGSQGKAEVALDRNWEGIIILLIVIVSKDMGKGLWDR